MSNNSIFDKDYFEIFGLKREFKQDPVEIRKQYLRLQSHFHPDNFANHSNYEKQYFLQLSTLINDAYQILMSPLKRAQYLLACLMQVNAVDSSDENISNSSHTAFLIEQMSLREEIEALKSNPNPQVLAELKNKISEIQLQHECALVDFFEQLISQVSQEEQQKNIIQQEIERLIFELQFYLKLDEELKSI